MAWALHRTEKEKPAAGKTDYWRDFWSNTEYLVHLHPLSGEGAFWGRGCIFCAVSP